MPVSYDSSSLLKCTVSFTYTRYLISGEYNVEEKERLNSFENPKFWVDRTGEIGGEVGQNLTANPLFGGGAVGGNLIGRLGPGL
jgi:hypothetical protein